MVMCSDWLCVCAGIELDKLDEETIRFLAYQRIQQLFPPKALGSPPLLAPGVSSDLPPPHHDSKSDQVSAAFRFTGRRWAAKAPLLSLQVRRCRLGLFSVPWQDEDRRSTCATGRSTSDLVRAACCFSCCWFGFFM